MKKIISHFVLFLILFPLGYNSCVQNNYIIKGIVNQAYDGQNIMLFKLIGDSIISVDTTKVKNGRFSFKGKEFITDFSVITLGNYPDKVLWAELILEKGTISVNLDSVSTVSGPLLQPLFQTYRDSALLLKRELDKLVELYRTTYNRSIMDSLNFNKAYDNWKNHYMRTLLANTNNAIGKQIFKGYLILFDDEEFDKIHSLMSRSITETPDVIKEIENRTRVRQERMKEKLQKYVDVEVLTTEGNIKMLSDYIGKSKFLLIDFWASWCGPCIADIPYLKNTYDHFHSKGLNILGISIDSNKESWTTMLNKISVPWDMVLSVNEKEIKNIYSFSSIPHTLLLNDTGEILEINIHKGLNNYLANILNQ